jgi:ribosomal protein S18 acetylase RimI-like enzyme
MTDTTDARRAGAVEPAVPADAGTVARLHAEGIGEGFLSSLGPRFLTHLYRSMAGSPRATLFVSRDERGDVIGFISGAVSPGAFYREFFRRHGVRAAALLAGRALRPAVLRRILETVRHVGKEGGGGPELLSVAVGPPARRTGLGSMLVRRLEEDLRGRGADRLAVVVGAGNQGARTFYERLGFHPLGAVSVHQGYASLRYEKALA